MPVNFDRTKGQFVWIPTYEDVKALRETIARDRDRLASYEPDSRNALDCLESIQRLEGWIHDAGYTVDPKPSEIPTSHTLINLRGSHVEADPPQKQEANYTAYFRLDNGTVDACDFYAPNWIEASRAAWHILNNDYREMVECEPYAVIRGKETLVVYPRGKKPVGKRFAEIIGLKLKEA